MAKYNFIQNAFNSGELSEKLKGRTDIREYFKGCEVLENFIPYRQGGAGRRPGTQYLSTTTLDDAVIIPFIVSKTEAYVVIINPRGNEAFPPNNDPSDIEILLNDGSITTLGLSGSPSATNILPVGLDPCGFHYAQNGDVLFITHNSGTIPPIIIIRESASVFRWLDFADESVVMLDFLSQQQPLLRRPYRDPNIDAAFTLTPSAVTGAITITSSKALFDADHVGAFFKITHGATTGVARVTVFNSTTSVDALVAVDFGATSASDNWQESSWSDFRGWPKSLTFFEQRLMFGGNAAQPDTFWGSLTNNPFHFMERRLAQDDGAATDVSGIGYFGDAGNTDPIAFTLASSQVNPIQWMSSGRDLQIGTLGAEYSVSGGNEILSSSSIQSRSQTTHGSSAVQPVRVNQSLLFLSRDGKRIRDFEFSFDQDTYITRNLSLLSDQIIYHLVASTSSFAATSIKQMIFQESRDTLWCLTSNNALIGLTIDKISGTLGWHKHRLGGSVAGGGAPKIHGIASIPNSTGSFDDLWLIVEREVNSATVYFVERMGGDFESCDLLSESTVVDDTPRYLDAHVYTNLTNPGMPGANATQSLGGQGHLEGETVDMLVGGLIHRDATVTAATVTITSAAKEKWVVGLKYTADLRTMPLEAGQEFGSAQGNTKRIDRATIKFFKTYGAKVGPDTSNLQAINFRDPNALYGAALDLVSGDQQIRFDAGPERSTQVIVQQDMPLPCNILSITTRGVMYD